MNSQRRRALLAAVVGAFVGTIIGAIVAVNFVITIGIDRGYEASIGDVFRENVFAGTVTVAILVAGPVLGAVVAWRRHRGRFADTE